MSDSVERLLTYQDVAEALQLSVKTVQNYKRAGLLPPTVPLEGNRVRWRAADINAWIQARREGQP